MQALTIPAIPPGIAGNGQGFAFMRPGQTQRCFQGS